MMEFSGPLEEHPHLTSEPFRQLPGFVIEHYMCVDAGDPTQGLAQARQNMFLFELHSIPHSGKISRFIHWLLRVYMYRVLPW